MTWIRQYLLDLIPSLVTSACTRITCTGCSVFVRETDIYRTLLKGVFVWVKFWRRLIAKERWGEFVIRLFSVSSVLFSIEKWNFICCLNYQSKVQIQIWLTWIIGKYKLISFVISFCQQLEFYLWFNFSIFINDSILLLFRVIIIIICYFTRTFTKRKDLEGSLTLQYLIFPNKIIQSSFQM